MRASPPLSRQDADLVAVGLRGGHPGIAGTTRQLQLALTTMSLIRLCLRHGELSGARSLLGPLSPDPAAFPPRVAARLAHEFGRLRGALAVAEALQAPFVPPAAGGLDLA